MDDAATRPIRRLVHVPALDVLRAFAVTIVVLSHIWEVAPYFHFREIFSNSGFLGVDLFFVLSGFLITALLLQEQHDLGRIRFRRFYLRRAFRLLPALLVMLAVYLVYATIARWPALGGRAGVFDSMRATLLYVMNWHVLWHPLTSGDLLALWSLAIEEQFYVVWPLVVLGVVGISRRAGWVIPVLATAAVTVTLWRVVVYHRWGWEAAYLRTDTRIDGLLVGALLASLFVRGLTPTRLPRWTPWAVVAVWISMMLTVKADAGFAYQGGITLWILASGAMVLYLVSDPHPLRSWIARGAEIVGKGSYAIYLWQVPVIRAVGRVGDRHAAGRRITLCLLGIAACTALSWFLVERPAQRLRRRVEARPWFSGLGAPPTLDGAVARGG